MMIIHVQWYAWPCQHIKCPGLDARNILQKINVNQNLMLIFPYYIYVTSHAKMTFISKDAKLLLNKSVTFSFHNILFTF